MNMSSKVLPVVIVIAVGAVILALLLIAQMAGYFTDPAKPLQAEVSLIPATIGPQGPQGAYDIRIYRCWDADTTGGPATASPPAPSGGNWVAAGGVISGVPADWQITTPQCLTSGQDEDFEIFVSLGHVDPAQYDNLSPISWQTPFEVGGHGPRGDPGTDGTDGSQGAQGQAGADGTDGAQGPQGGQGQAGADGTDGAQGPQGAQGQAGADGTGAQGPQGAQGLYDIHIYHNATSQPATPSGGDYVVDTGSLTGLSSGWAVNPQTRTSNSQNTYISRYL